MYEWMILQKTIGTYSNHMFLQNNVVVVIAGNITIQKKYNTSQMCLETMESLLSKDLLTFFTLKNDWAIPWSIRWKYARIAIAFLRWRWAASRVSTLCRRYQVQLEKTSRYNNWIICTNSGLISHFLPWLDWNPW